MDAPIGEAEEKYAASHGRCEECFGATNEASERGAREGGGKEGQRWRVEKGGEAMERG